MVFLKEAGSRKSVLDLENHPIFGGEAKRNEFEGGEISRHLDSITLEPHYMTRFGIGQETIRKYLSAVEGEAYGLGPDALSAYTDYAFDLLHPLGDESESAQMLPGGNAAHVEQWMDWQASDFNNSWRVAFQGLVRKNPDFRDRGAIEASMSQFSTMVGIVDAQLGRTGGYIAGSGFTVADIAIGLSLRRWHSILVTRPRYLNVERYYELLLTRSGFQRYGRDGGP